MDEHSWVPNVLSDTGGDVCRNCGVVSECAEIPCKRHPTFRGIPGYPPMHEQKQHDLSTREGCFEAFLEQKRRAEDLAAEIATLKATIARLLAQVQRLSGPVSEEWVRSQRPGWGIEGVVNATNLLNSLFAARSTPPAKEDSDATA